MLQPIHRQLLRIDVALSKIQLLQTGQLFREFLDWHFENAGPHAGLIPRYFNPAGYEQEILELPGIYQAPHGCLFIATLDHVPAGCVALRLLGNGSCEMKRLFVRPLCMGNGVGLALALKAIGAARDLGYKSIKLDTGSHQEAARRLYSRLGFRKIEPHCAIEPDYEGWLNFYELRLD